MAREKLPIHRVGMSIFDVIGVSFESFTTYRLVVTAEKWPKKMRRISRLSSISPARESKRAVEIDSASPRLVHRALRFGPRHQWASRLISFALPERRGRLRRR